MSQDTIFGTLISLIILLWNPIKQVCETLGSRIAARLPDNMQYTLRHAAEESVAAVEQLSHVADATIRIAPADRKAKALEYAQQILQHFGLKVPDSVISTYIEKAVANLADSGYSGNHSYDPSNLTANTSDSATQDAAPASSAV